MTQETRRKVDNLLLSTPLSEIHGREELHYLGSLIQDHDHFREILMTESDLGERRLKADAIRPYLSFEGLTVSDYEMQSRLLARGEQPFYKEKSWYEDMKAYPRSVPHYE